MKNFDDIDLLFIKHCLKSNLILRETQVKFKYLKDPLAKILFAMAQRSMNDKNAFIPMIDLAPLFADTEKMQGFSKWNHPFKLTTIEDLLIFFDSMDSGTHNVKTLERSIIDRYTRNRLAVLSQALDLAVQDSNNSTIEIVRRYSTEINELANTSSTTRKVLTASDILSEELAYLETDPDDFKLAETGLVIDEVNGGLNAPSLTCICALPKQGKALPLDSDIYTPNGIIKMKDIRVGHKIFGEDGRVWKVKAIPFKGICRAYKIRFSDGAEIVASGEHIWSTIAKHGICEYTTEEMFHNFKPNKYEIPLVKGIEFKTYSGNYPFLFMESLEKRVELLKFNLTEDYVECKTVQKQERIKWLIRSLGGLAIKEGNRIYVQADEELAGKLSIKEKCVHRYIESIEHIGLREMQCISTTNPTGMFVTNDFIVTHNSTFLYNSAVTSLKNGRSILFVTIEISAKECRQKLLSCYTGFSYSELASNTLSEEDRELYKIRLKEFHELSKDKIFIIDDCSGICANDIATYAIKYQSIGLDIQDIYIDYILIMNSNNSRLSHTEQMLAIPAELRRLSQETTTRVFTAMQLHSHTAEKEIEKITFDDIYFAKTISHEATYTMVIKKDDMTECIYTKFLPSRLKFTNDTWVYANREKECFRLGEATVLSDRKRKKKEYDQEDDLLQQMASGIVF